MLDVEENNEEEYVGCGEIVCDDDGIHYVCPTCGKYHESDLDALLCCVKD